MRSLAFGAITWNSHLESGDIEAMFTGGVFFETIKMTAIYMKNAMAV